MQTTHAAVDFELDPSHGRIIVTATVEAVDRTGVEMEALVAAAVAALTVYDIIKGSDRWASIEAVRLDAKSGGRSGDVAASTRTRGCRSMTATLVALRDVALSIDEVVSHVRHPGAGAVCVFLGTVRDHNEGAAVVTLEYEAYAAMALAEMQRIVEELVAEIPGVRLAIVHQSGALSVGGSRSYAAPARPTATRPTARAAP